ncbi:MAG TPA: hypothetical protein VN238_13930, partial [Solirubrobacteraceae bacterium]|nr:hypothetical protein [Solirubrobacteraceae bacterium]
MAKFLCVCGETIRTSGEIPNPDEWLFISDVAYEELADGGDPWVLHGQMRSAFVCPRSGHLWVYDEGFGGSVRCYAPVPRAALEVPPRATAERRPPRP